MYWIPNFFKPSNSFREYAEKCCRTEKVQPYSKFHLKHRENRLTVTTTIISTMINKFPRESMLLTFGNFIEGKSTTDSVYLTIITSILLGNTYLNDIFNRVPKCQYFCNACREYTTCHYSYAMDDITDNSTLPMVFDMGVLKNYSLDELLETLT